MRRDDFLGPATIIVAAGIPPMGTVFTAVPRLNRLPPMERPGGAPDRVEAAGPRAGKVALEAPHRDGRL